MSTSTDSAKASPTIFFIFGGTGDLTSRKLVPALYNLFIDGWMPSKFEIVAMGRTEYTDEKFRGELLTDINQFSRSGKAEKEKWDEFEKHVFFQVSDIKNPKTYEDQSARIARFTKEAGV
jgi:glucose-6-phosphate 1-dehydrogenase